MRLEERSSSPIALARMAGLLYLVIIVCGVVGQALVREPLVADEAAQTVANLLADEVPFRFSIFGDVLMVVADVGVGVLLFYLLAPVDRTLSMLAMAFRLAQAAVLSLNLVQLHGAVTLARAPALDAAQRDVLVTSLLDGHAAGYDLGLFFFAVNCLLVGVLLYRLHVAPRAIGIGIAASGAVYFVGSTLRIVAPELAGAAAPAYALPLVAELAVAAWLVTRTSHAVGSPRWRAWRPTARA